MHIELSAIIVDDEQDARDSLLELLSQHSPEIKIVASAGNAIDALNQITAYKPDILFIDVKMPGKDGFYVASELKTVHPNACLIFITSYDHYAIKAIRHAAFDFLVKPIDHIELIEAIRRYKTSRITDSLHYKLDRLEAFLNPMKIKVSTTRGFTLIEPHEVVYCIAEGNYSEIVLNDNRRIVVTHQIGTLEKQINDRNFVRISRSYLLNIRYLKEVNRKKKIVELIGELFPTLPVSRGGMKRLTDI